MDISCDIPEDTTVKVLSSKHLIKKEMTIADLLQGKVK